MWEGICCWLLNDEVSCIGIYGIGGGVGKTTLAMHMSIIKFLRDHTFYIKLGLKHTFFEIIVKRIKKNIYHMQI
jgi:hypothetical protein